MQKLLPILILATAPCFASAVELSFKFTGSLTSVTDQYGFLSGQFAVGSAIDGTFTYETNTAEGSTTLGDPTVGIYAAVSHFRVTVNGYLFEGGANGLPGYLQVWDDRIVNPSIVDAVTIGSPLDYTPPISGMGTGTVVGSAGLNLFDFTHSASKNGKVIPAEIDLTNYGSSIFSALQVNVDTGQAFHINGTVISLSPVPEPSTWLFLLLGLPVSLLLARRLAEV